jgi:hypothetical protein
VTDQAVASRADWLLFMAADTMAPDDIVPRMLEMDWPFVAPFIPTYGLRGEPVKDAGYDFPAEYAMPSAACVFIGSDVFRRVRWRWDYEDGSDDPCYWRDAREHLGIRARVRMDCTARHFPEAIGPVETRGHDMSVHR